jgi:ribosomal protein S12 methylthiotransferase
MDIWDMKQYAALVSLGCAKNLVDSETMIPQLIGHGFEMCSNIEKAALVLVNTCGFLESAVEEAIETILRLSEYKETGRCRCLVVAGCMVQRYGKKLMGLLPEVDVFLGTSHYDALGEVLQEWKKDGLRRLLISTPRHLPGSLTPRVRSGPGCSAYIKIAEGCDNCCSFCLIPKLRGHYRSRSIEDIIKETSRFVSEGAKEINLIAQDITAFGADRGERHGLARLLDAMENLEGLRWIRLLYTYPDRIDDPLLSAIARSGKIVHYLDMPIQHCSPEILNAMGRSGASTELERLIDRIRHHIPDIAIRTSIIVGFPGESEKDFKLLMNFVRRVELDHIGVFAFSAEPGARAAKLPFQVDPDTKRERRNALMEIQRDISRRRLARLRDKELPVLVEGPHPETDLLLVGRLQSQAPEVDGMVIITDGFAEPGQIVSARITATHDYDVEAVVTTHDNPA